jgi:CheY-like chemotaxis protein
MDLTRKRVLVVDDHPGMLKSLRRALEACGIGSPHAVRNAHEAVQRLRNMRYDIVLADFDLGPGPDGQQLLEHCRTEHLLAPAAIFVLLTAERSYDRVMSAAEFSPDDYMVKPFTEDTLRLRLLRALERKNVLAPLFAARAKGEHREVVQHCDRLVGADPRYQADVVRMKVDALLALKRFDEARALCDQVLSVRQAPWARLALSRAQIGLGEKERARDGLTELLADVPEFLAAYDTLSGLHEQTKNDADAKAVLRMALEVSPNALHRHKAIAEIALRTDDLDTAESAFGTVVRKGRNGFLRSADDHLKLSRVLMARNKFPQALETLSDTKKCFSADAPTNIAAAAVESLIHSKADNPRESRRVLEQALELAKSANARLDDQTAIELARACYVHNREHEGAELVRKLVSNNHDNDALLGTVRQMFADLDRAEQGDALIERSVDDAVSVNNEGVLRAKNGDLEGAIELLLDAATKMPDSAAIVMNAAHALIAHMQLHGLQADKEAKVAEYLAHIGGRNPAHPKYLQVRELNEQLHASRTEAA